jgi:hypothetical protein
MIHEDIKIYHIAHIDCLESMVNYAGIYSKNECNKRSIHSVNIAYEGIQVRRATTPVPCGARGTLHDYIPFYFAPRSPMLYAIKKNAVAGYHDGQESIIHVVSSVQPVFKKFPGCVFTDGHAVMALSSFFDSLLHLDKVDWNIMSSEYWNDIQTDGDRKRRRQAEFLVPYFFPLKQVAEIGVMTSGMVEKVRIVLGENGKDIMVNVHRNWYY